jgi:hypothetical protein
MKYHCDNAAATSLSKSSGLVVGAKRFKTLPSLPIRNLVKFHLISLVDRIPDRMNKSGHIAKKIMV